MQTREEKKQAQAKMSDSKISAAEEMPAGVKNLIVVNPEYKKIICRAKGCGRAIKAVNLRLHLQNRHRIGFGVAKNASQVARGFRWDEDLWGNVQPEDGLAPQVGVAVKDAFRCKRCRQYAAIFPENVDVHWDYHGHGVTEGDKAEEVRVQTWYGRFADGYSNSYWVVDESIRWNGEEDSSRELKSKPRLVEDECKRLLVEESRVVLRQYYVKNEEYQ
ncbi:hypothetical protein V498_08483 [Pseudogymnoascus sp. VKM F-4517 (FW-2822)]|nr:hypothetical protein V498_08483 [Pseudogymnoascus sp. VKM F-4517 (FW-2822)]